MSPMKEKAVEMIRRMLDDNMMYVINILRNLADFKHSRVQVIESDEFLKLL